MVWTKMNILIMKRVLITYLLLVCSNHISAQISSAKPYVVVNNKIANMPFGVRLTPYNLQRIAGGVRFELKKELITNTHSGELDTLFTLSYSNSTFILYRNRDRFLFRRATILDSGIMLVSAIRVGIRKKDLLRILSVQVPVTQSIILLTDDEHYSNHKFTFVRDRLTRIDLNPGSD